MRSCQQVWIGLRRRQWYVFDQIRGKMSFQISRIRETSLRGSPKSTRRRLLPPRELLLLLRPPLPSLQRSPSPPSQPVCFLFNLSIKPFSANHIHLSGKDGRSAGERGGRGGRGGPRDRGQRPKEELADRFGESSSRGVARGRGGPRPK